MSSMTEDKTYNGWTNYETWCVNLWISNEGPLYREALAKAEYAVTYADGHPNVPDIWTQDQAERYVLADDLKGWVTDELSPDLGATMAADLYNAALSEVNWDEIADGWLEQVDRENV